MALPEAATPKYNDFFASVPVGSLPKPPLGKVVVVKDTDSVKDATRTLGTHNILSAPIRKADAPEDAGWLDKYTGTADAVNLCFWLVQQEQQLKEEGKDVTDLEQLLAREFASTPISEVVDTDPATSRFAPFTPLDGERNSLLDCMILMGKYALHRCYVVQPSGDIVNVVTQSMLVEFLNKNMDKFDISDKTVAQLGLGHRHELQTVTEEDTFFGAFEKMHDKHVSALPLVDSVGAIQGVVSTRDARLMVLRPTRMRFMHKPLKFFEELHVEPFGFEAVCVKETSTLREVVAALCKTQVHRVFITDDNNKPTGVIALRDVLAIFVKEPADSKISDYFAA